MENELLLILDFGGQYSQLIARRVREAGVYCEIFPYNVSIDKIKSLNPKGIIFTGGPASVNDKGSPFCNEEVLKLNIPVLGICYGMQLMGVMLGGEVVMAEQREYGNTRIRLDIKSPLFYGIDEDTTCWMSHTYHISKMPCGFKSTAYSENCPVAAMEDEENDLYGVQFHPEVFHTPAGKIMLQNFLFRICCFSGDWKMSSFIENAIKDIREKVGDKSVICALSGGVDSSVAAVLTHKAVGNKLTCIFVDNGLLRKFEGEQVEKIFKNRFVMNLIRVDAAKRFLDRLKGITEPEMKRKIIGEEFMRVFEEEARKIGKVDCLVQGTIYPDVIESGTGNAAVIKSHHNVGGLPANIDFKEIIEPLRYLFKDEVRKVGAELGIPDEIVLRQPFPGPGLAVRIMGEVTGEKLEIVKESDYIFCEEIERAGLSSDINQYFTILTGIKTVGVMGDERTYDYVVALRAVTTMDFMTANWAKIPHEVLEKVSNRIVNEIKNVNRVLYDITSKPPATIEWE